MANATESTQPVQVREKSEDRDKSCRKVWIVVSSTITARAFLTDQLAALAKRYCVTLVANTDERRLPLRSGEPVEIFGVRIERKISLWRDIAALVKLNRALRKNGVEVVHSITPKAGLLAMLAGWIAGVPVRLHTFTGQVWATRTGAGRWVLKSCDRLIVWCATHITVDSRSQMEFLIREGVLQEDSASVLGDGSISGVDIERFRPNADTRTIVRHKLGASDHVVFLFVGRLKKEKGVFDLVRAFLELRAEGMKAMLVLVGPDEEDIAAGLAGVEPFAESGIRLVGHAQCPEDYMHAADVLCLPSYREGFGSVVIEAAACGVPAIASRIYGITDAVEEGVTGLLHPPGDVGGIQQCMTTLYENASLRRQLADNARRRAVSQFSMKRLTNAVVEHYNALLQKTALR